MLQDNSTSNNLPIHIIIIYQFTPFLLKDHILRLQWHQIVEVFFVLFCFLFLNFRLKFYVTVKYIC